MIIISYITRMKKGIKILRITVNIIRLYIIVVLAKPYEHEVLEGAAESLKELYKELEQL